MRPARRQLEASQRHEVRHKEKHKQHLHTKQEVLAAVEIMRDRLDAVEREAMRPHKGDPVDLDAKRGI